MNYPENMYKYRALNGIAMYTRVKDDIYEDTTCKHPGGPSPHRITHNGDIYVRRDVVEHIIRSSLGPKEALTKIRSL